MAAEHKYYHEPPEKGEKKWKHYLIEFFMLFLAVSLGFLTENLREHLVENQRAREMAIGLFDDLEKDSIHIHNAIKRNDLFVSEMNSLIITLSEKDLKNKITMLTYYQASYLMEIDMPVPSKANLDQLKNSGSLRYFKDKKLVTNISQWENIIAVQFEQRHQTDQLRLIEEIKAVSRVFYPVIIDSMRTISYVNFYDNRILSDSVSKSFEKTKASLLTYSQADINEVIGWASERKKNAMVRSAYFLPKQLEHIRNLMHDLDKEFDIKKKGH